MGCMVYAVARSKEHLEDDYDPDLDGEFKPNMINSVVFLVGAVQQVTLDLTSAFAGMLGSVRVADWLRSLLIFVTAWKMRALRKVSVPITSCSWRYTARVRLRRRYVGVNGGIEGRWLRMLLFVQYPPPIYPCYFSRAEARALLASAAVGERIRGQPQGGAVHGGVVQESASAVLSGCNLCPHLHECQRDHPEGE